MHRILIMEDKFAYQLIPPPKKSAQKLKYCLKNYLLR